MDSLSDEALVRLYHETREDRPYILLMNRHLPKIRRLLYTLLPGSSEDREDVEQEILAALYFDLPRFRFGSAFSTLVYRYARNKAVDRIRKNQRERKKFLAASLEAYTAASSAESPEELLLTAESARELLEAVLSLPLEERIPLFLKESEGLSVKEISEVLRIPSGTVKSRLHRARGRVADRLTSAPQGVDLMEAPHAT